MALLTATLVWRPFPARLRPADLGGLANMRIHRTTCVATFLASLASILLHLAPDVLYTLITKRGAPPVDAATLHAGRIHLLTLLAAFVSAGCMRRGPLLRAREARLGSGFGIAPSPSTDAFDWRKLSLDMDEDPNMMRVIDYGNSSMLTFLTLGYVSLRGGGANGRASASRSRVSRSSHCSSLICLFWRNGCARVGQSTSRTLLRRAPTSSPRPRWGS
jgi:hypothetical protein